MTMPRASTAAASRTTRLSRRRLLQGAAGLALALPAASLGLACGPAAPARAKQAGQSLNFMIIQPHVVAGEILARQFEEQHGVKVNVTAVPYDQVQAKATLDVQSGANQFDVIDYWYPTIGALAEQGIVEDITGFIDQDPDIDPGDFIPTIYDTYTLYNGRRYGLPYDGDTHVLFYNAEIFERHGLKAPTTWDEYLATAKAITEAESKNGIYGAALMAAQAPIIIASTYSNRLGGFGGAYLDKEGKPTLDSEAAVLAARALVEAAPYALPTPLETAFEQGLPAFLQGKAAMIEFWTDLGVYSQDPKQSQIVDKWDVVQIPVGGSNTTHVASLNAGFGFAVSTGSKQKELAKQFIKWATSKQLNKQLITTTGSGIDPTRLSALNSEEYATFAPKVQKAATASLNGAFAWPTIPQSPDLMKALSDELALALQGKKGPEEAIRSAQEKWQQILAQ